MQPSRARDLGLVASLLLALAACDDDVTTADDANATAAPFAEGSRDARAAVAFVNDVTTDAARLKLAGMTKPTATAVLAAKNGADGVAGTDDDEPHESLEGLDAIKGVGPATLRKLSAYARARGYGNERGIYHGVYFNERQADRVLDLVNTASLDVLDEETSVDSRALDNIAAALPVVSMSELASLSRVKSTALRLLRDHADRELGEALCSQTAECADGLLCWGADEYRPGRCIDNEVEGDGSACSAEGVCGPGLVCAGRSEGFEGICNPAWMREEFANEGSASLPEGPTGSVGVSVEARGLATVPTDAVVRVLIDHPRPEDLELTLDNPIGTRVMVHPRGAGPLPAAPDGIVVNVPGDEDANGLWTLTVTDTAMGEQGAITLFALELTSRFD